MFIPSLQQEGIFGPGNSSRDCIVMFLSSANAFLFSIVHEVTLVHTVSVLSQWTGRLTVEVPSALLDWLKKAFTLKTSTSLVRHAYLQVMLGAFRGQSQEGRYALCQRFKCLNWTWSLLTFTWILGDTLAQASELVPLLLQTVEKSAAQHSQQGLLAEGVAASVLLSRLALLETQTGEADISEMTHLWRLLEYTGTGSNENSFIYLSLQRLSSQTFGAWSWMKRSHF